MPTLERLVLILTTCSNAKKPEERIRVGTGYLADSRTIITAAHCVSHPDDPTADPDSIKVTRAIDGSGAAPSASLSITRDEGADVAVIRFVEPPWVADLPRLTFGAVDRVSSGVLEDCVVIGYPLFARDDGKKLRQHQEVHGDIGQTNRVETGHLLMHGLHHPGGTDLRAAIDAPQGGAWDGMSGGVVFWGEIALGIVVEHHPLDGTAALLIRPFTSVVSKGVTPLAELLGLPELAAFPLCRGESPGGDLSGTVALWDEARDDLPRVSDLDPYRLGADRWQTSATQADPYVPRTASDVDARLDKALEDAREHSGFVVLVGESKTGKTRTAFEAIRRGWSDARLAEPRGPQDSPDAMARLVAQLRGKPGPVVVWLDEIDRYLTGTGGLTRTAVDQLKHRDHTLLIGTIRPADRWAVLHGSDTGREAGAVLRDAVSIDLGYTSADGHEQEAAQQAYPSLSVGSYSLPEILIGVPELLDWYDHVAEPEDKAIVEAAVDFGRLSVFGRVYPPTEETLLGMARGVLEETHPHLVASDDRLHERLMVLCAPLAHDGHPIAGRTAPLSARVNHRLGFFDGKVQKRRQVGFAAFDYLASADDGAVLWRARRPVRLAAADAVVLDQPFAGRPVIEYAVEHGEIGLAERALARLDEHSGTFRNLALFSAALPLVRHHAQVALPWMRRAADAGSGYAAEVVALLKERDEGISLESIDVYKDAFKKQNIGAVNSGAVSLAFVAPAQALPCFALVALSGHWLAMRNLRRIMGERLFRGAPDLVAATARAAERNLLIRHVAWRDRMDMDLPNDVGMKKISAHAKNIALMSRLSAPAEGGDIEASFFLGRYAKAEGDLEAAVEHFTWAARRGHTYAMRELAIFPNDRPAAVTPWLVRAARSGDSDSLLWTAKLLFRDYHDNAQAEALGNLLFLSAAELEHPEALQIQALAEENTEASVERAAELVSTIGSSVTEVFEPKIAAEAAGSA